MKKKEHGARVAITWLEEQFREGNRWLRPQKSHEKKLLADVRNASQQEGLRRNKTREDWYHIKILECCNHFTHHAGAKNACSSATRYARDNYITVLIQ